MSDISAATQHLVKRSRQFVISNPFFILVSVFFLLLFIGVPIYYGSQGWYLSNLGDAQQFMWQAKNLSNIIRTGQTLVSDSFFGVEMPYAYTPIELLQGSTFLILNKIFSSYTIAYNLSIGIFLFLNFFFMYYVLRRLGRSKQASLVFSVLFGIAPSTILHATGHISLFIVFTIPLFFYLLERIRLEASRKHFILLALVYALTFYIHEYYAVGLTFMGVIFVLCNFKNLLQKKNTKNILVFLATFMLLLLPVIKLYYDKSLYDKIHGIKNARSVFEGYVFAANPLNYIFPSQTSPLYSQFPKVSQYLYQHVIPSEQLNYLGIVTLLLFAYGFYLILRRRISVDTRQNVFYVLCLVAALLLSFGPYMIINGANLYLPVALGYRFDIPPFDSIRAYGRFGIFAVTICFFAGAFLYDRLAKNKQILYKPLIVSIIIIISFFETTPVNAITKTSIPVPEAVYSIKTTEKSYVLHAPFQQYGSNGNTTSMLFQLYHKQPMVNGYSSFNNPEWESKITQSVIRCFHFLLSSDPSCSGISSIDLKREGIQYIVFEKKLIEPLPGYLTGVINEPLTRERVKKTFENCITNKIFEDDFYIIGQVYE